MFRLTMLGSGSAGNSALVATDHCKLLVDGGLSARQLVLRLAQWGVTPDQLMGFFSLTNMAIIFSDLKFSAGNLICRFIAMRSPRRQFGAMDFSSESRKL